MRLVFQALVAFQCGLQFLTHRPDLLAERIDLLEDLVLALLFSVTLDGEIEIDDGVRLLGVVRIDPCPLAAWAFGNLVFKIGNEQYPFLRRSDRCIAKISRKRWIGGDRTCDLKGLIADIGNHHRPDDLVLLGPDGTQIILGFFQHKDRARLRRRIGLCMDGSEHDKKADK